MEDDEEHDKGDQTSDSDGNAKKKKNRKKKKKPVAAMPTLTEEDQQIAEPLLDHGTEAFDPSTCNWVDVTSIFDQATQGMKVGEMIESPQFRLFDAMSAIEIMDPKMDSGFNNSEDMTMEKAVESGIITRNIPHEDLVAIWDQLLMYYLLWLDGHTIVQTCFCCLYLHDLEAHVKPIPLFGAFVDAFLVACRSARSAVLKAGVFDDEDFLPSMFGINLDIGAYSTDPGEVRKRLEKERQTLSSDTSQAAQAVACRLEFIGEYMLALIDLDRDTATAASGKSLQDRLTSCLGLVEKLEQSSSSTPCALRCFDPSINRKLLVPGPPRTVEPIQDPHVTFSMWGSHVHELLLCDGLSQKSLMQLLDGCITYKDQPNVLTRSIAQLHTCESGLIRKLMLESLSLFHLPKEASQHCKKVVDGFLERSESLFAHMLKLTHSNCARRFRRLAHIFSDFNSLQHEAWSLDENLRHTFGANLRHPQPCWNWIMEHCVQAMITKLMLGFELELYEPGEFHMIYWYADYLYGLRVFNLKELHQAAEQAPGAKKRPGARPQQAQGGARGGQKSRNIPPFVLLLEATQHTVRGLFRLLAFCLRRNLIISPPAVTEGLAQRFVLRFRALEHFRLPHLPSFHHFEQSALSAQAPVDSRVVLEAAQSSFADAAQQLERLGSLRERDSTCESSQDRGKALKRVVVANQLAITQLLQSLVSDKKVKVAVSTAHHPHLVSVQVSNS